jgi:hypothetical protein
MKQQMKSATCPRILPAVMHSGVIALAILLGAGTTVA